MGSLPARGRAADEVLSDLESFKVDDKHFRGGRVFGLVFHVDEELERVLTAAHDAYLWHNALNPDAFPSLRRITTDIIDISASLFGGDAVDDDLSGFLSSGGTESILMAVKAAKVHAARERDVQSPNVVLPM